MDNQKFQATVLATVASVLAMGVIILEDIRTRRFIIRQPCVNRDYEREGFILLIHGMQLVLSLLPRAKKRESMIADVSNALFNFWLQFNIVGMFHVP